MRTALLILLGVLLPAVVGNAASPYESPDAPVILSPLDRLILDNLRKHKLQPAAVCSDAVFVRRVYLDVIGTLPTAQEVRSFLADANAQKRRLLIDRLLEREEYADYWATKWCDLLRVKAEFPVNLWPNAAQAYHRWLRTAVRDNKPYDRFARELLVSSGSNFRVGEVNFYRALQNKSPEGLAAIAALNFMGVRFDKLPREQQADLAAFFSQVGYKSTQEWKEEIVFWDSSKATQARTVRLPDGATLQISPDRDPRELFAEWLISPKNPYFARNIVNRQWAWLLGRGFIHEPDDIRPDNPPSCPEALAFLERELVSRRYDLKHVFRVILNSRTYQLTSVHPKPLPQTEACFAFYAPRRLEAEVLIDAINQITGTGEQYSSAIPEPYTFIPANTRALALPDGSISSSFLEMFGRPTRDTGLEAERVNRITADQCLHLLNSSHVLRKVEDGRKLRAIFDSPGRPEQTVEELYLTVLSRFPTDEELQTARRYGKGREALVDVTWALLNSAEFLYRH